MNPLTPQEAEKLLQHQLVESNHRALARQRHNAMLTEPCVYCNRVYTTAIAADLCAMSHT